MSAPELASLISRAQQEVSRQMSICNACRYCEGLCAVFPAMELRTSFAGPDVDYLANLCHKCGACYYDCQYAPPHEFAINVPQAMEAVREESYARHAWPAGAATMFERNAMKISLLTVLLVAVFVIGFVLFSDPQALFASGDEAGAFYRVLPHSAMVMIFGAAFSFSLLAMALSVRNFWRTTALEPGVSRGPFWQAVLDSARLRYLDGGGMGCMNENERPDDRRRRDHHLTFYGFMLCFASTTSATIMAYVFAMPAPYGWWSLPVVFGVLGGIGLILGPIGLLRAKSRRDPALMPGTGQNLDKAFLWMLLLVSATGLLLLVLRATPAMGILLAVHLGFVLAFFLTMPYGKFVHGLYRFAALLGHSVEQKAARATAGEQGQS